LYLFLLLFSAKNPSGVMGAGLLRTLSGVLNKGAAEGPGCNAVLTQARLQGASGGISAG
jgi:hypothetical protein